MLVPRNFHLIVLRDYYAAILLVSILSQEFKGFVDIDLPFRTTIDLLLYNVPIQVSLQKWYYVSLVLMVLFVK